MNLEIAFQPKQAEVDSLIETGRASTIGYGGSKGGAKSGYIRRGMLRRRYEHPGTSGQIVRRVWDDVLKNHIVPFFEEYPELAKHYRSTEHVIELPTPGGISRIYFDSAENANDVQRKAMGPEFMDIFVDQAEQFTETELKLLKTTCRWPGMPDHKCKFGLFFNVGGVGAAYLRRVFYAKQYHDREKPEDYSFVQAYGWDNVEWCRAALKEDGLTETDFYRWTDEQRFAYFISRSQYGRELDSLDKSLRSAYLLGEFDSFAGQYFDVFDPSKHVIPKNEVKLERWWPKWVSGDWGFQHPACFHWHAKRDDGRVVTYREEYQAHVGEREWGTRLAKIAAEHSDEKIQRFILGPDAWAKRGDADPPSQQIGEELERYGWPSPEQADAGPGSRVSGARFMHQLLETDSWLISLACPKLIETLPILVHDKEPKHEDVLKINATESTVGDDAYDCARMGLKGYLAPGNVPIEIRVEKRIAEYAYQHNRTVEDLDINAVAMLSRRAHIDEFRKRRARRGGLGRVWHPQTGA